MASGIERSKFIRPMANALGWTTGRLRGVFQRADYHSPYTDLPRALRILQAQLPEQLPAVLKALNLDTTALRVPESAAGQQLALMPPAALATPAHGGALTPDIAPEPADGDARVSLVDRLAESIPGDESFTDKRARVRTILKKHGVDGRFKDEVRALAWVKKVFPDAVFKPNGAGAVEVAPDIETLPAPRLRELVESLMTQLAEKDRQLKQAKKQLNDADYFLDAYRIKMVGKGLLDVTEDQALFFLGKAAVKKPL